ncbi:hypothetical protein [uncultured Paludibaculum sp.]|uniref:hypothetical protein n=1 Tax=uncultured Paludibaculum sp. TaxID=1765020 RepID=UPI002AAC2BA1|nr:hypothetical protein [uncultured Paludibaculum sp.]
MTMREMDFRDTPDPAQQAGVVVPLYRVCVRYDGEDFTCLFETECEQSADVVREAVHRALVVLCVDYTEVQKQTLNRGCKD